jgi:23S rRNA pseudouridine1911/1915/1917 synthase
MIEIDVTHSDLNERKRIDVFVTERTNFSRRRVQDFIKNGLVMADGVTITDSDKKLSSSMKKIIVSVEKDVSFVENTSVVPRKLNIEIIYEDDDIAVLNKQAGLPCHPSCGHHDDTLSNALVFLYGENLSSIGTNAPGIVHRLDMNTSGVIVIAKNNFAHSFIADQFGTSKGKNLKRVYVCYVYGRPNSESGVIDAPIGRHPKIRQKNAVLQFGGRKAVTLYKTLSTVYFSEGNSVSKRDSVSKVRCELLTGRTHQIRVHMQHLRCPIIGDDLYCSKIPGQMYPEEIRNMKRQALHSKELTFLHPRTLKSVTFTADMPDDIKIIDNLFAK